MRRLPKPKEKKSVDPGLMAAVQMANYQWQVKKAAIKEMTVNKEIEKAVTQHRYEIEDEFTDWMYGAFALALHRKCKFGAKRIASIFEYLQEIKNGLIDSGMNAQKIWELVRDEIGLDVTMEE